KDNRETAVHKLEETSKRISEARLSVSEQLLAGPVQGGRFIDLREKASLSVGKSGADVFAIGGIVPLMERYEFSRLIDTVMTVKMNLPPGRPVHAFGCGHPMLFSLLVLAGVDLFDSAAYALYAEDKRYMTVRGTFKIDDMHELPCSCPACSGKKPSDMDKRSIAMHNLYVTFGEIRTIRQAIMDGALFELVEQRVRAHPALLDAYVHLLRNKDYSDFIEKYDPVTKGSAFFYTGTESVMRPAVHRARKRLHERYVPPKGRKGYLVRSFDRFAKSTDNIHFIVRESLYGVVPSDILNIYPFGQTIVPATASKEIHPGADDSLNKYISSYRQHYKSLHIISKYKDAKDLDDYEKEPHDHLLEARSVLMYQYGGGAEKILYGDIKLEVSRKTGRLRRIYVGKEILGTIRAEDGMFVPARLGAERLKDALKKPSYRVVVSDDAVPFIMEGKSVFSRFVIDADREIRPYDEVLIVDSSDKLVGTGRCLLNYDEMMDFRDGVAVKTRIGFS
ncbi:MAG: tRNA-guanine transglycosylase, partial [Candidatus Aenigmarchaeota archaeon]|nr:tRNA-guanine transglycosylase [Candidatus Aenigmarchaeota archaeon]